ncbi:hypothetical protein [Agrobacterium tumefaciens]|uniref:hypothetical protein n=1 Tax=Agrobacterium tumefaciens TaxID=358 RepID=UPI002208375E|nr:MFS transporter [Agrobacterium tumefaciens]UXT00394.1 MFS transporter [Agrobacterium tumefaciens]
MLDKTHPQIRQNEAASAELPKTGPDHEPQAKSHGHQGPRTSPSKALFKGLVAPLTSLLIVIGLSAMSRNIGLMLFAALMFTMTSVSNSTLVANFLMIVGQLRPEQLGGLFLLCGALPLILWTLICVFLLRRGDSRLVLIFGLTCFALASLIATNVTADWRLESFIPVVLLQSAGHGFTFLAIIIIALANSNPARATAFSAYIQVLRLCGPWIGGALTATWLRVRKQTHSNLLGQHVASGDANVEQTFGR